jgi:hypothetical protein
MRLGPPGISLPRDDAGGPPRRWPETADGRCHASVTLSLSAALIRSEGVRPRGLPVSERALPRPRCPGGTPMPSGHRPLSVTLPPLAALN